MKLAALATMKPAELRQAWKRAYKVPPPRLAPELLRMGFAYRLQEKAIGKLPIAVARALDGAAPALMIKAGSQLVRSWNGRDIIVLVTEDGFLWDGKLFRSLTAIAREVTGAIWSGPRFFGLTSDG